MPSPLPSDHLERVYAGVVGNVIGVYLGRPFEGWPREAILSELGHVRYYVHEKCGARLIVVDDDISATFMVPRAAFDEHGHRSDLTSDEIGSTLLNNAVENGTTYWWGGRGLSTEHTAMLNLLGGISGEHSGSVETNGAIVAEQLGAQIFIDGWALATPAQPDVTARLATAAAKVTHGGECIYAAVAWAVMESEAFRSNDVKHLFSTALKYIPSSSAIARVYTEIPEWADIDKDWEKTRQRIEDKYYGLGFGHILPNHAIKVLALVYGGQSFHEALYITVTSGMDTDSNGGNIGCLLGIMHGLAGIDQGGPNWRGPVSDRCFVSSADPGYAVNDMASIAYDFVNMGRKLVGEPSIVPKEGAKFHFTLPGSVQGFQQPKDPFLANIEQAMDDGETPHLAIRLRGLCLGVESPETLTTVSLEPELSGKQHYSIFASPTLSPGQTVKAYVKSCPKTTAAVTVQLILKRIEKYISLTTEHGPALVLQPGNRQVIEWTIPDDYDGQPIQQIGLGLSVPASEGGRADGTIWLESLDWSGTPSTTLVRPSDNIISLPTLASLTAAMWRLTWLNNVSSWIEYMPQSFFLTQRFGEGSLIYGSREWHDYSVTANELTINMSRTGSGLAVRVRGLNRWYALLFQPKGKIALVKAADRRRDVLASKTFKWSTHTAYQVEVSVQGARLKGYVNNELLLEAQDDTYKSGAIGMIVSEGSMSVDKIQVGKAEK
ncbi:hypothetical protein M409DRAFT_21069 [Zasmidium cellare ATCC 36951]|uniref:ADP-ribosylglycohydrolase n=1 Tax=Zasmidium cellare ATCC 36951 TaxID=1080233 RepID=A0A6A6CSC7_ZASCE|nr:uncharacterized protein M409DRAFT_21069 [Zasmidium cellare ATCC 36951]KAF2169060.1 hypothetical protein M409DRAFT_21069 [Zasmidium cellare ATCC 36951]